VSTSSATSYDALPANAQRYLQRIAELMDVPISTVSIGSQRRQAFHIDAADCPSGRNARS